MKLYKIAFSGDNEALHQKALEAAVAAAEEVNKTPAYRAWIENVEYTPSGLRETAEMSEAGWTDDDDRSRAIHDLRIAMREHMGVSTEGLTDDEVLLIFSRRVTRFGDAIRPMFERLRALGIIEADPGA